MNAGTHERKKQHKKGRVNEGSSGMNERVNAWTKVGMDGRKERWMDAESMDAEWMDGWMDGGSEGGMDDGWLDDWMNGCMHVCMPIRMQAYMHACTYVPV